MDNPTEKKYLEQLEERNKQFVEYLKPLKDPFTSAQLVVVLQNLEQWGTVFQWFVPYAQSLNALGQSHLFQRLSEILNEYYKTVQMYQQIYAGVVQTEQQIQAIQENTRNRIAQTQQQIYQQQRDSQQQMHRNRMANYGYCPRCGNYTGVVNTLCLNCVRQIDNLTQSGGW
jgi:RNA polymerase-binding transcription factor DksA